jgi:predicted ATP-grasp superfamily ATP-dependent carboligase
MLYHNPKINEDIFIDDIINFINNYKVDVLIPIGISTCVAVSKNKQKLSKYVKLAVADYNIFKIAHDKSKTLEAARKVGVPIPKSFICNSYSDAEKYAPEIGYPLILKARKGSAYSGIMLIKNKEELKEKYTKLITAKIENKHIYDHDNPLIQEFIPGDIYDVCVFAENGKILSSLSQKRLRTLPVNGGGGIRNITTWDEELIKYAKKLINEINYHGPAQIEFKLDHNGQPRLMEINPKFWGTLDLSIAAGINFPQIAVDIANNKKIDSYKKYQIGLEYAWVVPYQMVYFLKTKHKLKYLLESINFFKSNVKYDIKLNDLLPSLIVFLKSLKMILNKEKRAMLVP